MQTPHVVNHVPTTGMAGKSKFPVPLVDAALYNQGIVALSGTALPTRQPGPVRCKRPNRPSAGNALRASRSPRNGAGFRGCPRLMCAYPVAAAICASTLLDKEIDFAVIQIVASTDHEKLASFDRVNHCGLGGAQTLHGTPDVLTHGRLQHHRPQRCLQARSARVPPAP